MKIIGYLIRSFFNLYYKFRPPEMVSYWKTKDAVKAKILQRKDGSMGMQIEGEKYIYPGFPRGHVLTGALAKLKHSVKNMVFNQAFAEIQKMADAHSTDMLPPEKMVPAVRHIWETFEKLEECEVVPDMKARMALIKKVLTFFLMEDDAYRFRAQLFLDLIDQKKIKLSKEDMYYFRAKYYKPDRYKKFFGKVFDAYEY